jgi:CRP-like cAMP-binding protein
VSEALESTLASVSIFELLRADEIARVASRFETHTLADGEALTIEPEAPRIVVLVSGRAELSARGEATRLDPGDRWGDVALLSHGESDAKHVAKLVATKPAVVATLDRDGFDALLAELPAIALPLARELASFLHAKNDERRQILELHAEELPKDELEEAIAERKAAVAKRGARVTRLGPRALFQRLIVQQGAEPPFWMLLGFLSSLGGARLVVALILKYGLEKRLFALVQGTDPNPMHVHHFNYGLIVASVSGVASLFPFGRRALRFFAATFGLGIGLIFDEFALIWNLNPEYSQSLSLISAAIAFVVLVQLVYFRRFWGAVIGRLTHRVHG